MTVPSFTYGFSGVAVGIATSFDDPAAIDTAGAVVGRDLLLAEDGDLNITGGVTLSKGLAAIRQAVELAFSLWRGAWFLDVSAGTPWFDLIGTKGITADVIRATLTARALQVAGVGTAKVTRISQAPGSRAITFTMSLTTEFGELTLDNIKIGGDN